MTKIGRLVFINNLNIKTSQMEEKKEHRLKVALKKDTEAGTTHSIIQF